MDGPRPPPGQAAFRQGEVRQQPRTFLAQGLRDDRDDFLQLLGGKAVQEEVRDPRVIRWVFLHQQLRANAQPRTPMSFQAYQPRTAASMAATSIFFIVIIASKARLAAARSAPVNA